jgi:hypothetical protein
MLEMKDQLVKQLALSRNHENAGDEKVAYMSIAYTEIELSEAQVDGLMGPCTYRSWFNINGKDIQPMDWTKKLELGCDDKFRDVSVSMLLGKRQLEFDGCRLYVDKFKLVSGGGVLTDLHIHVLKAKDSEWNLVGQHEFSEVKLSLGNGVVIERKARKQRELPFGADPDADTDEGEEGTTTPRGPSARLGLTESQRDTTHVHWQQGENGERGNGPRCDMPADCVEVDPPVGSRSEAEQEALEHGEPAVPGTMPDVELPPLDGHEEFAKGVAKAVDAHVKRGSKVIDGRSERVKHRDRQRTGGAH